MSQAGQCVNYFSKLTLKFLLTHVSKKEMAVDLLRPASKTRCLYYWILPGLPGGLGLCFANL